MEYDDALSQITEIHAHLKRSEVYRDIRALPVALSGVLALLAASLQTWILGAIHLSAAPAFVLYWVALALLAALLSGAPILSKYLRSDRQQQRHTRIVFGQFVPCLLAGVIATAAFVATGDSITRSLPGLWALLFGLGIFSARPYLPRAIGFVALFYMLAGGLVLAWRPDSIFQLGYAVGVTFGLGQLASGAVLYWNLERQSGNTNL